jgi:nitrogen fixation protein NifU and related proteins
LRTQQYPQKKTGTLFASIQARYKSQGELQETLTMRSKQITVTLQPNSGCRHKAVMNHAAPQNEGRLKDADALGFAGSTVHDEHLELSIKVDPQLTVTDAKFRATGSPALLAVGSVVTQLIRGNSLHVAMSLNPEDLDCAMGHLPELRRYTTNLAITALRQAALTAWKRHQNIPLHVPLISA